MAHLLSPHWKVAAVRHARRVIAMPMRAAAGSLKVVTEQNYFGRAPLLGQADTLETAVLPGVYGVFTLAKPYAGLAANPINAVFLGCFFGNRPCFAFEDVGSIQSPAFPPLPIARVEHVGPRRNLVRRIYADYSARGRLKCNVGRFAPHSDGVGVVSGKAGAAGNDNDGRAEPTAGDFPALAGAALF